MLDRDAALGALQIAQKGGADFAEVFMEDTESTALSMVGGKMENAQNGRIFGAGVRVMRGVTAAYAYTNDVSRSGLARAAEQAAAALDAQAGSPEEIAFQVKGDGRAIWAQLLPGRVAGAEKAALVREADRAARDISPEIVQVSCGYSDVDQRIWVCNTAGVFAQDRRVRVRLAVQAVASDGQQNQTGFEGPGAAMGFEAFRTRIDPAMAAQTAARTAVTMLHARECPAGRFPVAIDSGFGGVIFHEACGHSLEATSVAKGASVFCGMRGKPIAAPCVTAIDDGTLPGEWGSAAMDDEGNPTQRVVLIENGILKNYLVDRLGGRRMGMEPTGCGRRQSYRFAPTSRMSNTFIAPGESTDEEIIASIDKGLYAKKMGGGSVNPVTGDFNFAVQEGYWVKNGRIQDAVRGATLIGKGAEVLMKIDKVGGALALGQGMCGSLSGSVPTNVGQPMIRVSSITVGGR